MSVVASSDGTTPYLSLFDGDAELAATWVAWTRDRDPQAREALVETYIPLVRYVVSRLNISLPPSLERGDLVGFGTIGLIDAVSRFDLERGLTFQTYAVTRIRGAILDELRAMDWVPRSMRARMHQVDAATERIEQERGHAPDAAELAEATGLGVDEVRTTVQAYRGGYIASLDERLAPDADSEAPAPGFVDQTAILPDEAYDQVESQQLMRERIRSLPDRDRAIIALYYFEELTFSEIGRILSVSESRACQLHARAIRDLRTLSVD